MVAHQRRADLCRGIVQPQFVRAVPFVLFGFDGGKRVVPRQRVRRQVGFAEEPPHGNWLVAITVQKIHDDLLTDTRDRHMPPLRARPILRHAYPARAVFVVAAQAVPRKLHFDPAMGVAEYFFVGRTDDGGRLWAIDARLAAGRRLPVGFIRHEFSRVAIVRA
ncbi:hypothetical protein D3C72_1602030 [compost metagenome]